MHDFLLFRSDAAANANAKVSDRPKSYYRQSSKVFAAMLLAASLLAGCQQQSEVDDTSVSDDEQIAEQQIQPAPQSDSAAAHIKQLQPVYVEQMQSLQRRLQAEYESLQAADLTTDTDELLLDSTASPEPEAAATENEALDSQVAAANSANMEAGAEPAANDTERDEQELTVLRRISAEPRKPTILTDKQIIDSYQQTIEALYRPTSEPLTSEEVNTLINIAALIPQLFEHTELADRLNAKSPALARLIVQHQIWEQIEARQASYMQEMKIAQQQEFESLMAKFNETIKDYDEQIAKYEQTLKEFQ